jgi:hypothetical protein
VRKARVLIVGLSILSFGAEIIFAEDKLEFEV